MSLLRRDPRNEIDTLFESFFGVPRGPHFETEKFVSTPVDVLEEKDRFVVKVEIPGVNAKDLSVNVENGLLTIRGEKRQETEEKGRSFHRVERHYGSFQRALVLPGSVDPSKTEAQYRDGVLTVRLPKHEEARPKTIEVKVTEGGKAASA